MIATSALKEQNVWLQKPKYDLAEKLYYEKLAQLALTQKAPEKAEVQLVEEIPKAVQPQEKIQEPAKKIPAAKECPEKLQKGLQNASKKEKVKNETAVESQVVPVQDTAQTGDGAVEVELTIKCNSKKPKKVKKDRKRNNKNNAVNNENIAEINSVNATKGTPQSVNTLAGEVAKAREHIKNSMQSIDNVTSMGTNTNNSSGDAKLVSKINQLEKNNAELKQELSDMKKMLAKFEKLEIRVVSLEKELASSKATATKGSQHSPQTKAAPAKPADDDDDGVDLFGSDSEGEDTEAAKIKEQRLAEYAARKSKKPVLIAKSNIILDVKPWDDETDMKVMEENVRKIATDGLIWGASKLVPLAYGIHKLQISCVVEDDKVSVDWLQETIEAIEDYVQSVDIAAFNKV